MLAGLCTPVAHLHRHGVLLLMLRAAETALQVCLGEMYRVKVLLGLRGRQELFCPRH